MFPKKAELGCSLRSHPHLFLTASSVAIAVLGEAVVLIVMMLMLIRTLVDYNDFVMF